MCGIFGVLSNSGIDTAEQVKALADFAEQRGSDSSGFMLFDDSYKVFKADMPVTELSSKVDLKEKQLIAGHSRLATNGTEDNQPVVRNGLITIHNGIICNTDDLWAAREDKRQLSVDTEIIPVIVSEEKTKGSSPDQIAEVLFDLCEGEIGRAHV